MLRRCDLVVTSPRGSTDNADRWYPDKDERHGCCSHIRSPSGRWPWSLYRHAYSAKHVACSYGLTVTDVGPVRRAILAALEAATV